MRVPTAIYALATFALALICSAHRIEIEPGEKECFYETLQPQDKVSLSSAQCRRAASLPATLADTARPL
jgi:hypothetical protein